MKSPEFDSIEEATVYLNGRAFSYPSEVSKIGGAEVLLIFRLTKTGSARYKAISRGAQSASLKDHAVSVAKSVAADTGKAFKNAASGDVGGMFKSLRSVINGMSTVNQSEADARLGRQGHQVYLDFEKAFQKRQWLAFRHVIDHLRPDHSGPLRWYEREVDGCQHFMYKL